MVFFFWLAFSIIVGVAASHRGRSGFGWFLIACVITPLLALLLVFVIPKVPRRGSSAEPSDGVQRVKCPECAELVLPDARKCKHCGAVLQPQLAPVEPAAAPQRISADERFLGGP
jgi:uncharacterized membrane protein YhdT